MVDEGCHKFLDGSIRWSLREHDITSDMMWVLFYNENEAGQLGVRVSKGVNVSLPVITPPFWELVI